MNATDSRHYLFVVDFDRVLSHNDAGVVLAGELGFRDYTERAAGIVAANLVQPGGEFAYLLAHDPDFRRVRREHLHAAGGKVALKHAVPQLAGLLHGGIAGLRARFFVISAAPRDLVIAALDGIVGPDQVVGSELDFDALTGAFTAIRSVPVGLGRVQAIDRLASACGIPLDRSIYVGDGSIDVHTLLHVNQHYGFTVAVAENRLLGQVAQSTVLSEHSCSILMPVLEQVLGWRRPSIRTTLENSGLRVDSWQKTRTDTVRLAEFESHVPAASLS